MFKRILVTFSISIISLLTASLAYASSVSIRLEAPKTPTNQNTFSINFVALDITGGAIEVKCYKTGDGTPFQTVNLSAGGNTGNCEVTSSIMPTPGTYGFYVTAIGSDTVTSPTVNVEYTNSSPNTPNNYSKEQQGSCQYKISFRTAPDGGQTSRVEIYRSDQTNFTADGGTRVGTVWIGSDMDGTFTDTVPDCGKTYYYVIRAFNGAGNGSGITGDSVTNVTIAATTSTTTSGTGAAPTTGGGAIPVTTSGVGQGEILGQQDSATEGGTLGESTESATLTPSPTSVLGSEGILNNNLVRLLILAIIAGGGYLLYRRSKS